MTDEQLEQRLRAWYRNEVPADETAPFALRSRLATIPNPSARSSGQFGPRRGFTLLAAAVLVGLVAGAAVVGGLLDSRPGPVVVPSQSPSSSEPIAIADPSPTPQSPAPTAEPCFTDTMTVLTGEAMQAATGDEVGETMTALGQGRGVYVGRVGALESGVWAVGPADGPARPIAVITPRPFVFDVVGLSPDGSEALIRAGTLTINGPDPECVDLYLVRTDGSGATRLTPFRGGRSVSGAAFSPDGTRVAYSWWGSQGGSITVLDLGSGRTVDQQCGAIFSFDPNRIEWSPTGERVAIACSGIVTIFDPSDATDPVPFQSTREQLLFGWTHDGHVLVSTDGGDIRSFDVESQTSMSIGRFDVHDIEQVTPSSGGFSPDGRWLVFQAGERGDVPGNDFTIVGYLVSTSGGTPIRILNENEAGPTISWSTDGRSLLAAHESGRTVEGIRELILGRLDPETLRWSEIGPLLAWNGVWQVP